ncbi:MAG: ATP-binding cassette domain-containing protein, partial [Acidimicrobiaceae bacterium]|nr:ATP-binding cassette domain-containing protein [Acidimicrobiaceae bacterium]
LRRRLEGRPVPPPPHLVARRPGPQVLRASRLVVRYGARLAIAGVDISLAGGQVTALMGRNGSGKSSLLWAMQGSGTRQAGSVEVHGLDPRQVPPPRARRLVGLVPQSPADLLYLTTVAAECDQADRESGAPAGSASALLERLVPGVDAATHPRDLSEGQRLALVIAIQLAGAPPVVLLDEPTRGLDYQAKRVLLGIIDTLAGEGRAVVVATHDVEFVAASAERVVVLAAGELVADGPTEQVIGASPAFAPQVAKILAPLPYLTVDQVALGLEAVP